MAYKQGSAARQIITLSCFDSESPFLVARTFPDFIGVRRVRFQGPVTAVKLLKRRWKAEPNVRGQSAARRARDARIHFESLAGNKNPCGSFNQFW